MQLAGRAEESALNGVDGGERNPFGLVLGGCLIQTLLQVVLHGAVPGIVKVERTPTGAIQACRTVLLPQADDSLGGAQVVQDPGAEKSPDQAIIFTPAITSLPTSESLISRQPMMR